MLETRLPLWLPPLLRAGKPIPAPFTGLPGYVWDVRFGGTGRYRVLNPDGTPGRLVSRRVIIDELRRATERAERTMVNLGRMVAEGRISPATFERAMMLTVKQAHMANAALSAGGWDRLTQADFGRVGGRLRYEYRALGKFGRDIQRGLADGTLNPDAVAARASLYGNSAYGTYWRIERIQRAEAGHTEEHWRTQGDTRVCQICQDLEGQGWVPIGTHPDPGSGPHPGCRCELDTREKQKVAAWDKTWYNVMVFDDPRSRGESWIA